MSTKFQILSSPALLRVAAFQAACSLVFQTLALRELAARFSGMEAACAAGLCGVLFWSAMGCMLFFLVGVRSGGVSNLLFVRAVCLFPLAALASLFVAACFPNGFPPHIGLVPGMLLFSFLSPVFFGLANGALLGASASLLGRDGAGSLWSWDSLGAALGGAIASVLLSFFPAPFLTLGLAGSLVPLVVLLMMRGDGVGGGVRAAALFLLAASIVVSVYISTTLSDAAAGGGGRNGRLAESVETSRGRVELRGIPGSDGRPDSFSVRLNGRLEMSLPIEFETKYPAAAFALLQPFKSALRILCVGGPLSRWPSVFLRFPFVASVDLLSPDRTLSELAGKWRVLPDLSSRFALLSSDARKFLEQYESPEKYDMLVIDPSASWTLDGNRLLTREFLESARRSLAPDGVLAVFLEPAGCGCGFSSARDAVVAWTLSSVFSSLACAPGGRRIMVAGMADSSTTADLDELDRRLSRLCPNSACFPPGMMGVVFSQLARDSRNSAPPAPSCVPVNSDSNPVLPLMSLKHMAEDGVLPGLAARLRGAWAPLAVLAVLAYLAVRYVMSRKINFRLGFSSLENGACGAGLVIALLFVFQCRAGGLYQSLPICLAAFFCGSAGGGVLAGRMPSSRRVIACLALLAPATLPMISSAPGWFVEPAVFLLLFAAGMSAGFVFADLCRLSKGGAVAFFLAADLGGGALGVLLFSCLAASAGLPVCALSLALLRAPLLLQRNGAIKSCRG